MNEIIIKTSKQFLVKVFLAMLLLTGVLMVKPTEVKAYPGDWMDHVSGGIYDGGDGNYYITTGGKKKDGDVCWHTVGFYFTAEEHPEGATTTSGYERHMKTPAASQEKVENGVTWTYSCWNLGDFNDLIATALQAGAKMNGNKVIFYAHSIIQTSGTKYDGQCIYNSATLKAAAGWANTNFSSLFNKRGEFEIQKNYLTFEYETYKDGPINGTKTRLDQNKSWYTDEKGKKPLEEKKLEYNKEETDVKLSETKTVHTTLYNSKGDPKYKLVGFKIARSEGGKEETYYVKTSNQKGFKGTISIESSKSHSRVIKNLRSKLKKTKTKVTLEELATNIKNYKVELCKQGITTVHYIYAPIYDPVTVTLEATYHTAGKKNEVENKVSSSLNNGFGSGGKIQFTFQKGSDFKVTDYPVKGKSDKLNISNIKSIKAVAGDGSKETYKLGKVKLTKPESKYSFDGLSSIKSDDSNVNFSKNSKAVSLKSYKSYAGFKSLKDNKVYSVVKKNKLAIKNVNKNVTIELHYYNVSPVILVNLYKVHYNKANLNHFYYYREIFYVKSKGKVAPLDAEKKGKKKTYDFVKDGKTIKWDYPHSVQTKTPLNTTCKKASYVQGATGAEETKDYTGTSSFCRVTTKTAGSFLNTVKNNTNDDKDGRWSKVTKCNKAVDKVLKTVKTKKVSSKDYKTVTANGATTYSFRRRADWEKPVTLVVTVYEPGSTTPPPTTPPKQEVSYGKLRYVKNADGSFTQIEDGNESVELKKTTTSYTTGFPVYYEDEAGTEYMFKRMGYSLSPETKVFEQDIRDVHKSFASTGTSTFQILDKSSKPIISWWADGLNNQTAPVVKDNLLVFYAIYEPVPNIGIPKENSSSKIIPFGNYDTYTSTDFNATGTPLTDVDVPTTSIYNDKVNSSSEEFIANLAIPTTEYLKTEAEVPRFLYRGEIVENTYKKEYKFKPYLDVNIEQTTSDTFGNESTTYSQERLEADEINVSASTTWYTLGYASTYVPKSVTAENTALNGTVTMYNNDTLVNPDQLKFEVTKRGSLVPAIGDNIIKACQGIESCGSAGDRTLDEIKAEWNAQWKVTEALEDMTEDIESSITPPTSMNDEVVFYNGETDAEGNPISTLIIAQSENPEDDNLAPETNIDVDMTYSSYTDEAGVEHNGAFDSKNTDTESNPTQDCQKIQIKSTLSNGVKPTKSLANYTCNFVLGAISTGGTDQKGAKVTIKPQAGDVNVYTPVCVNFGILTDSSDFSQVNSINTSKHFVLDKEFSICVTNYGKAGVYTIETPDIPISGTEGTANEGASITTMEATYPGYGYQDYSRYSKLESGKTAQIKFEFPVIPVYENTGTGAGQETPEYYPANTWIDITAVDDPSTTQMENILTFYVPTWAPELSNSNVQVRAVALNAKANNKLLYTEKYANNHLTEDKRTHDNYVAFDNASVSTSGRVYGLSLFDMSDYPTWQNVFRDSSDLIANYGYYSGYKDENGNLRTTSEKYTVPLIAGSHPSIANSGFTKPGYVTRFKLQTIGGMTDDTDYIQIVPRFYYQAYGSTIRREVDVYYDETINGTKANYVKAGGSLDKANKHYLDFATSDMRSKEYKGLGTTTAILQKTAKALGYSSANDFINKDSAIWTTKNIMVNKQMRTFVGDKHVVKLSNGNELDLGVLETRLLQNRKVSQYEITSGVQDWYFTYYLPSSVHVLQKKTGIVNPEEIVNPLDYNWLSDGYLIVNFDIYTINNGKRNLYYDASELGTHLTTTESGIEYSTVGVCNMWNLEGYMNKKTATDKYATMFTFDYGDVIVYDLGNGSNRNGGSGGSGGSSGAAGDYSSGGTH